MLIPSGHVLLHCHTVFWQPARSSSHNNESQRYHRRLMLAVVSLLVHWSRLPLTILTSIKISFRRVFRSSVTVRLPFLCIHSGDIYRVSGYEIACSVSSDKLTARWRATRNHPNTDDWRRHDCASVHWLRRPERRGDVAAVANNMTTCAIYRRER